MTQRNRLLVGFVVVAAVIILVFVIIGSTPLTRSPSATQSTDQVQSTTVQQGNGIAPQTAAIKIDPKPINSSWNGSVSVRSRVTIRGYEHFSYDEVKLCLYNETGTVLERRQIGKIVSPEHGEFYQQYEFNLTVDRPPQYIIVDHPRLRNDSIFYSDILSWNSERGSYDLDYGNLDEIQNQFEWPRTNKTGKCG